MRRHNFDRWPSQRTAGKMSNLKQFVGHRLRRNVVNRYGTILLTVESVFQEQHIPFLLSQNIILDESDFIHGKELQSKQHLIYQALEQLKIYFQHVRLTNRIPIFEVKEILLPLLDKLAISYGLMELLGELREKDDYTYCHSLGVGLISGMIGRWMEFGKRELSALTVAALFHDVGKIKISSEILNKPGKLTKREFEIIKRHTVYGYELIKNSEGATHRQALVALQHHEREDGSGYPFGIKQDRIDLFSKIVAVADVFHAMTSRRAYHDAIPFYKVIRQMQQDIFGKLEPKIVNLFIQKIMNTLVGKEAILSDGRRGRIVMVNPHCPADPLVKVGAAFLDLSKNRSIYLEEILK